MRRLFLLLSLAAGVLGYAENTITLADANDKSPVAGASVISANGLILGVSDSEGIIKASDADFPLSVRSLGYEAATAVRSQGDTIFLTPAAYSLSEVTVSPGDRPITRVVTFAREYMTGATSVDTLQVYSEYMLEYFFADGKVKGYKSDHSQPSPLASRVIARKAESNGTDTIMYPDRGDEITYLSFVPFTVFMPYDQREITDAMKKGASSDIVPGKYFPKYRYRLGNGFLTINCDQLCDEKKHTFSLWALKMLGLDMEVQEDTWTLIYRQNDSGKYNLADLIYGTYNIYFLGKGKIIKKVLGGGEAIGISSYIEQYPVETEYLTAEEYKELKKTRGKRTEEFRIPANIQPLPPSVKKIFTKK